MIDVVSDTDCPFYHLVPDDQVEQLRFRSEVKSRCHADPQFRNVVYSICARDILFWINTFVWTCDPRLENAVVPFNTYPVQDEALLTIQRSLGVEDIVVEKSRDQGASWMFLMVYLHAWLFKSMQSFLLFSRNEDLVDKRNDPDSLFWKLDFVLERLPKWMVPLFSRKSLQLQNEENGSVIDGCSTTGNAGRGGRRRAVMADEFGAFELADGYKVLAATQAVTRSRHFNSTPQGVGNAHSDMALNTTVRKIRLHWSDHPVQSRGLYTTVESRLELCDESFWRTATVRDVLKIAPLVRMVDAEPGSLAKDHYPFVMDGKLRSPYYDNECNRTPIQSLIAQELDIDYLGSGAQFFDQEVLRKIAAQDGMAPIVRGDLEIDPTANRVIKFDEFEDGPLSLWFHPGAVGQPAHDRSYVLGIDIGTGQSASNSVCAVGDRKSNELVAMYVSNQLSPEDFADVCCAIGRWFYDEAGQDAKIVWESNGPGGQFTKRIVSLGYSNLYERRVDEKKNPQTTDKLGWYTSVKNKRWLLGTLYTAMKNGDFVNRSRECLEECQYYVYGKNGIPVHSKGQNAIIPGDSQDNHGDRVIACSLVWVGLQELPEPSRMFFTAPLNTLAGRREHHRRIAAADNARWGSDSYVPRGF